MKKGETHVHKVELWLFISSNISCRTSLVEGKKNAKQIQHYAELLHVWKLTNPQPPNKTIKRNIQKKWGMQISCSKKYYQPDRPQYWWGIWKERNNQCFKDTKRSMPGLKLIFFRTLLDWMSNLHSLSLSSVIDVIDSCNLCDWLYGPLPMYLGDSFFTLIRIALLIIKANT